MPKKYRATRNSDGTFNIHDVEVFGELSANACGNHPAIDRAWLNGAIRTARRLEGEQFRYGCHVAPSGSTGVGTPAGYIRLSSVRPITYRGKRMQALFADMVRIPADVFESILRSQLPYREASVLRLNGTPEINSLSLRATRPPMFQFPVLDASTIELDERALEPAVAAGFAAFAAEKDNTMNTTDSDLREEYDALKACGLVRGLTFEQFADSAVKLSGTGDPEQWKSRPIHMTAH